MRDLTQAPTECLPLWSWCCSTLLLSWKVDNFIEMVIPHLFFNQNCLRESMHVHICECILMYFCAWLGCGTTAKSKPPDLMLLLCWLLVLLLLAFTLPNKRSHPAGLHGAHLWGRQKHFLAFRLHTNPVPSPSPHPGPVTNDLRQAVNEKHKVNTI